MEYNSQRSAIKLPEYGRAVQEMVEQICTIEDREERTAAAFGIIKMMGLVNPATKDQNQTEEIQQKLWDHLYIISDHKLEVDGPFPPPDPEAIKERPKKIPYPKPNKVKQKHYGAVIPGFIEKAKQMDPGPAKDYFIEVIANLMKKAYLLYNKDTVNEELIREHLKELSDGALELPAQVRLRPSNELIAGMQDQMRGGAKSGLSKKRKKKKPTGQHRHRNQQR